MLKPPAFKGMMNDDDGPYTRVAMKVIGILELPSDDNQGKIDGERKQAGLNNEWDLKKVEVKERSDKLSPEVLDWKNSKQ